MYTHAHACISYIYFCIHICNCCTFIHIHVHICFQAIIGRMEQDAIRHAIEQDRWEAFLCVYFCVCVCVYVYACACVCVGVGV